MTQATIERLRAKAERAISAHADLCKRVNDPKYPDWADDALELCTALECANAVYGHSADAENVHRTAVNDAARFVLSKFEADVRRNYPALSSPERAAGDEREIFESRLGRGKTYTEREFMMWVDGLRIGRAANQAKGDAS